VSVGTFAATDGKIAVMLHDRGEDWKGTPRAYAHHAASAVRANCTG
jgi:translation initiation factor IF-2